MKSIIIQLCVLMGMVTSKEFCSLDADCNITKCKDNITVQCLYGSCSCVESTPHACTGLFDCLTNICTNGGIGTCVESKCICVHNQACTSVDECSTLYCNTGSVKKCINSECICVIQ
ncbi:serine protease inhibitor Cvsi-2-like [Mytilus trossulus]|uniref:serine protease inhibitor Cvsi-2-like n=1 Tax=Mytilus trossulus TaxID=6551 RepID=UPI003005B2AC